MSNALRKLKPGFIVETDFYGNPLRLIDPESLRWWNKMMNRLRRYLTLGIGIGDILGTIASVIGIGSGANSLFGSRNQQGGSSSANTYVPTGLGAADQTFQNSLGGMNSLIQQLTSDAGGTLPAAWRNLLGLDTSELARIAPYVGGANRNAAGLAESNMNSMVNMAGGQNALGNYINNQGMQLWNTAQDPQQALQKKLMQQVQEQSRNASSAAGLGTSGVGVGAQNDAMTNFLIDWENQQLGRQVAGMGGLNSALKTGQGFQDNVGQDLAAAQQYASSIPGYLSASATQPFDLMKMQSQWPIDATNIYGSAMQGNVIGPNQASMSSIIPYLNQGLGATNQAYGQQQTGLYNTINGLQNFGQSAPNAWAQMMAAFNQPQQGQLNYDPTGSGAYYGGSGAGTYGPS